MRSKYCTLATGTRAGARQAGPSMNRSWGGRARHQQALKIQPHSVSGTRKEALKCFGAQRDWDSVIITEPGCTR
eukprot:scaffold368296_cov51-Attheya_sp.AAC.2